MSTETHKPLERFRQAIKHILTVPKDEMARREEAYLKQRKAARKAKA